MEIDYSKIRQTKRAETGKPYWFQVRFSGPIGAATVFFQVVGAVTNIVLKQNAFLKKIHLSGSYSDNLGAIKSGVMQVSLSMGNTQFNRAPELTVAGGGLVTIPNNIILYGELNSTNSELEIGYPIEVPALTQFQPQISLAAQFPVASLANDLLDIIATFEFAGGSDFYN